MTHLVGYFTSYDPQLQSPGIIHKIQQDWGGRLERMTYEQKIVFRAALADYIANKPVHQPSIISLIDGCIESAGVDWNVWDEDEPLVEAIQHSSLLEEEDIEGLIEALTAQIRGKIYSSRTDCGKL
jgi:hypothetical protein